ncbi:MAG: hypothetical protein R3318_02790, partial [Gammaproteobacteria bacterium]|nr:hypothetical protein [Gammaproteobacteria bacterium]
GHLDAVVRPGERRLRSRRGGRHLLDVDHGQVTMNGYGAGTLSNSEESREVMIYENDGPWEYMDSFMVFIEYTGPVAAEPLQ